MSVSLIHAEGVNLTKVKQLTCQQYYPVCQTCTNNQWLLPFEKFSSLTDTLEVESDESEVIDKDNYLITGNVVLKSDSHFLSADKVEVSITDESSKSSGNVKYQDKNFLLTSDQLDIQKENDGLIINVEKGNYQEITSKANGIAENLANKEWARKIYVKAEKKADDSNDMKDLGESILKGVFHVGNIAIVRIEWVD